MCVVVGVCVQACVWLWVCVQGRGEWRRWSGVGGCVHQTPHTITPTWPICLPLQSCKDTNQTLVICECRNEELLPVNVTELHLDRSSISGRCLTHLDDGTIGVAGTGLPGALVPILFKMRVRTTGVERLEDRVDKVAAGKALTHCQLSAGFDPQKVLRASALFFLFPFLCFPLFLFLCFFLFFSSSFSPFFHACIAGNGSHCTLRAIGLVRGQDPWPFGCKGPDCSQK
jgi:hypothetical protein